MAQEFSGITGNVGTLAWVSCCQQRVKLGPAAARTIIGEEQAAIMMQRILCPSPPPQAAPEMLLGARCTEKADM